MGFAFITVAAFSATASTSTTHHYHSVTYYHYNPWYKKVLYDGEEGYILTTPPFGRQVDELPEGAETMMVEEQDVLLR